MIGAPPPFWAPPVGVGPAERRTKRERSPTDWKKWLLVGLATFIIDNNVIWYYYWKRAESHYQVRIVRVYTTTQGPCIPAPKP